MEMPKCTVCAKDVEGIGPLDVPYHVECVIAVWDRAIRSPGTYRVERSAEPSVLTPVALAYRG